MPCMPARVRRRNGGNDPIESKLWGRMTLWGQESKLEANLTVHVSKKLKFSEVSRGRPEVAVIWASGAGSARLIFSVLIF